MKYISLFLIICLTSCNQKKEELIPFEGLCDCYSTSTETNLDTKFNNCIDFKKVTENYSSQKYVEEVKNTVKRLIKECPKYQQDFNKSFLNKFENPRPSLVSQKDSLIKCIDTKIEVAKNNSKLAEISIQEKDFDKAMAFVNKALEIEQKNEYCHWIKSYLFQKKNNFNSAIEEFKFIDRNTTDYNTKGYNELMIENLNMERLKNKASI
jgi:tetratricopeptide (TPR) repeat protein